MYKLADVGYDSFFSNQVGVNIESSWLPARIVSEHRGEFDIWSERGEERAKLSAPLYRKLSKAKGAQLPGVGDWVAVNPSLDVDGLAIIEQVYERRTVFTRGAAGREARVQVVAANVETVFMVSGLDDNYNIRRIERYLTRISASGASPVLVLNKSDVCEDFSAIEQEAKSASNGVPVVVTSALNKSGLSQIRSLIQPGQTAVVVGSSGTGKSTLINALCGKEVMETGDVREKDSKGRHVTTRRQLLLLPEGGMIIDTPGMRELQVFEDEGLDNVFSEIEVLVEQCRFGNCTHQSEPGCAVRTALDAGEIHAERLENYLKMESEAKSFEQRKDVYERRKADRSTGKMIRTAKRSLRDVNRTFSDDDDN